MRKTLLFAVAFSFLFACANETSETNPNGTNTPSNSGKSDRFQDGAGSEDGAESQEQPNPFAAALDPELHQVVFAEDLEAPDYDYPRVDSGFYLSGTEFWQKWSDGLNPTYSYSEGSEFGRRCMYASALRFKALMNDPPESMVALKEGSNWTGSFFNWYDDYSDPTSWGDGNSARLWAWRTTLIKWISQTNADGSCYLPTRALLEVLAADCLEKGQSSDGSIQGCSAP